MPTKTNSPLHISGFLKPLGAQLLKAGGQRAIQGVATTAAKTGLKGLIGAGIKANPIGAAITGAQALFGGIKEVVGDRKEAKAAGEDYKFFEGVKDFGAGALKGATGVDLTDQDVYEEETPTYSTNIDQYGQEIPLTMAGKPIKALMQMQGTLAHNMSAKQYNKALQMKEISGASTIPSPMAKMSDRDYDGDGKVESSKEEYFGSRDKAIKENKN
tara:strand:- start:94 stop:738 length:645 start_codon:yes stop_codon:yes gene_type:complete